MFLSFLPLPLSLTRVSAIASTSAQNKAIISLSPSQRAALRVVLGSRVSVITGGPGVGKTAIMRVLLDALKHTHIGPPLSSSPPSDPSKGKSAKAVKGKSLPKLHVPIPKEQPRRPVRMQLCAPTGRAAQRLTQVTGSVFVRESI